MKFKLVNGEWKLLISDYAGATPDNLKQQLETLQKMTRVLDTAATDVNAGKYPTAPEAEAGIQQKLYEVVITAVQRNPPTQPATAPAGKP
jgi:pyrroline-5-carboxylate reductase